ncbi:MAG: hypothetical protein NTZ18_04215 [Candidatus Komeilibacteria bacterium]|nr:hypothetical protein [Candidatus Komeilibacteria bacterium]
MNEKLKRIIIISLFVLFVIGAVYLLYYFFFKQPTTALPAFNQNQNGAIGQLPSTGMGNVNRVGNINANAGLPTVNQIPEGTVVSATAQGGYTQVNRVTDGLITAPAIGAGGSVDYFNSAEGRFYRQNADGTVSQLTSQRFYNVSKVTWSPNAASAILEYPDGSNILYDFSKNKQYTLPKEMQSFAFSKAGGEIAAAAIGPRDENNWIVTSNPDGSNIQFVERLGANAADVDINWSPNGQVVAMFRQNISADNQEIIFIGRNEENFKSLITNGRGFEGKWTAAGDKLLYSVYNSDDLKPKLWLTSASGDNIGLNNISLGLATWSSKCVMSADNTSAYCGVPQDLPFGSGLYPELAKDNPDLIYKINLTTAQVSLLAQPVGDQNIYSVKQMLLSPDEKTLYWQDAITGKMFDIKL